jgi:hypothetical protein
MALYEYDEDGNHGSTLYSKIYKKLIHGRSEQCHKLHKLEDTFLSEKTAPSTLARLWVSYDIYKAFAAPSLGNYT